jgi:centrosomal protein CEP104
LGRLQLILVAIPTFGLHPPNKMGLQIEYLMSFVDQAFNNANGDVRNIAVKVITEVYKLMGSPVEKYLKNVKPVVREVCKIIAFNFL